MFIFKFLLFIFGFNMNIYRHKQAGFSQDGCATCGDEEFCDELPHQIQCKDDAPIYGDLPVGVNRVIAVHQRVGLTEANFKQFATLPGFPVPIAGTGISVNTLGMITRGLMFQLMRCVSRTVNADPTANTKQKRSGKDPVITSNTYSQGYATNERDITGEYRDVSGLNKVVKNPECYHLIIECCADVATGKEVYFHPAGTWSPSSIIDTNSDTVGECKEIGFGWTRTVCGFMPRYCMSIQAYFDQYWDIFCRIPLARIGEMDDEEKEELERLAEKEELERLAEKEEA